MPDSLDAGWLDVASVNEVLVDGGRWAHGSLTSIGTERVGADYGFSGRVHRLHLSAPRGAPSSLIAKFETAEKIARAVAFRDHHERLLTGQIPASFGARIDVASDRGLILLEDIHPATQGDDLTGCTTGQAKMIVGLIAMLHARTWDAGRERPGGPLGRWTERNWERSRWADRLERAANRCPDTLDAAMKSRLSDFPAEAARGHDQLVQGAHAWIHHDPHPDNALWRMDGRLVMLDWSGAIYAPPGIDVAVLLSSLAFSANAPLSAESLLIEYTAALRDNGLRPDDDAIRDSASAALRLLIRGTIGWAGLPEDNALVPRALALRAQAAPRAVAALHWLDR